MNRHRGIGTSSLLAWLTRRQGCQRSQWRWISVPLLVMLAYGITIPAQRRLDAVRQGDVGDELLYLPQKQILKNFTAGLNGVVADVLWIKCVQYTIMHFKSDQKFPWLTHMCDMITDLDPYFVDAYRYGSIFLSAIKADDAAGFNLLCKGYVKNPTAWILPYEMSGIFLLNRREQESSVTLAAEYLRLAVLTGTAPPGIIELAAQMAKAHDLAALEEKMWADMLHGENETLRELAERKLEELGLRTACGELTKAAEVYKTRTGEVPKEVSSLAAAGLIRQVPTDPLGGSFLISPEGKVLNTTLLNNDKTRALNLIRNDLQAFHKKEGRWPASLDEMKDKKVAAYVPAHPYPEQTWSYDPRTGEVN